MNYYNPYFLYPYSTLSAPTTNLLGSSIGRGFSFSSLLNGAQRTLNFVNQAIPVVKQVSPMMKNAKTMFRVMNEFKKVDIKEQKPQTLEQNHYSKNITDTISKQTSTNDVGPTFFA